MPSAGHDRVLPLYDPIVRLFGFRKALGPLLAQGGLAPELQRMREAGFADARRTFDRGTLFGRISAYQATA